MIILGIETSCDETAISLIRASGNLENGVEIQVLADKTLSQIELHRQYGGVFPNMAKREHSRNLIPLLENILLDSGFINATPQNYSDILKNIRIVLEREKELLKDFETFIPTIEKPPIDAIAVTEGPGLEPCLWTGINLAKALALVWDIPVIPVNHMEGHIFSALLRRKEIFNDQFSISKQFFSSPPEVPNGVPKRYTLHAPVFPSLALLISGGHTELVLIKNPFEYEIVGQTRDDAVGEAFDKVARLLGLSYPGGPPLSALAERARKDANFTRTVAERITLPRPMIRSDNLDFSFSGLKTAVLYLIKKLPELTDDLQKEIALEFENAITEVLVSKTEKAITHCGAQSLLIGGGVIANRNIRRAFETLSQKVEVMLFIPETNLTTDNALMIAVAGFLRLILKNGSKEAQNRKITAKGALVLDEK